ncbi:hypothetical protein PFISCL1PPCAC_14299 [Pristionchus fissidentatus]|uniref:G protein-coupled receptor n=1 Tax=Pristionchus fissidentatus TaxID=1538716 RepID=A0AAV5VTJ3_9BILA|nr:hypothetical protein PFISCL1PPCAC_14299 [Pristionchus fissidentatus]
MLEGSLVATLYGPILFVLPNAIVDFLYLALIIQVHVMWEFLPAPSILQYLSLTKSGAKPFTRLLYAYAIPFNMLQIVPSAEFRRELAELVYERYGAGPEDCKVYGVPIRSKASMILFLYSSALFV